MWNKLRTCVFLGHAKMGNCAQIARSSLLDWVNSIVAPCREQRDSACTVTFGCTCRPLRELNWIVLVNMRRLKDAELSQPMTKWCLNKSNGHVLELCASLRAVETKLQHARVFSLEVLKHCSWANLLFFKLQSKIILQWAINTLIYKVQQQIWNIHKASAMLV